MRYKQCSIAKGRGLPVTLAARLTIGSRGGTVDCDTLGPASAQVESGEAWKRALPFDRRRLDTAKLPLPAKARGTRALSDDRRTARNVVLGKSEEAGKQHRMRGYSVVRPGGEVSLKIRWGGVPSSIGLSVFFLSS